MKYRVKPEYINLWGEDCTEETVISSADLDMVARGWNTTPAALIDQLIPDGPAQISIDNGHSFISPKEAIARAPWEAIVAVMDDGTREAVHAEGIDTEEEFLTRYLELAPSDLIIG